MLTVHFDPPLIFDDAVVVGQRQLHVLRAARQEFALVGGLGNEDHRRSGHVAVGADLKKNTHSLES